jgi:hypothetical protein
MAAYTFDPHVSINGAVQSFAWTLTTADHTGDALIGVDFADRTFTFVGTWGGATAAVEGSNDGTNWMLLSDAAGATDATASTNKAITVVELTRYIRPRLTTAGSGATVTVHLLARNAQPLRS